MSSNWFNTPRGWRRHLRTDLWFDIGLAATALVVGLLTAARFFRQGDRSLGFVSVVAAFAGLGIAGGKAIVSHQRALKKADPHALDAVLHTLYRLLLVCQNAKQFDDPDLRLCVFVPDSSDKERVRRLTNFAHHGDPRGEGEIFPLRAGVVGIAMLTGKAMFDHCFDGNLVEFYHGKYMMTLEEAAAMNQTRRAWAAVPLSKGKKENVVALLFADSSEPEFFGRNKKPAADGKPPKETNPRRKMLLAFSEAIAEYVKRS